MACLKCASLLQACKGIQGSVWQVTGLRWFQTSVPVSVGQKWRTERGQAANNSRYGPLTDLPDYSYLGPEHLTADGRPTPLSIGQKRRRQQRIKIAKRIKTLTDEMFMAKENYEKAQKQTEAGRQEILQKKLRPKVTS